MKTLLIAAALVASALSTPSIAAVYNFDYSLTGDSGDWVFSLNTDDGVFNPSRGATEFTNVNSEGVVNGAVSPGGTFSVDIVDGSDGDYLYAFEASPGLPELKIFDFGTVDGLSFAQGAGNTLSFVDGSFHGYTASGRSVFPSDLKISNAVSAAPEPALWTLMGLAVGGMGLALRRKRRFADHVASGSPSR